MWEPTKLNHGALPRAVLKQMLWDGATSVSLQKLPCYLEIDIYASKTHDQLSYLGDCSQAIWAARG